MIFNKSLIVKDPLFKKFQEKIKNSVYLKSNDKVIVAVSGGMDSVALITLLYATNFFHLLVAHINHDLRKESDDDQLFVQDLSKLLNIPFFFKRLNPELINKSINIEEWARIKRYSFLNDLMVQTKSNWIMTGHHANDQAETVLMNLSNQAGVLGLRGIAKQKKKIVRPLLDFTKKEIIEFSKRTSLSYKEDLTNSDITRTRNFIRHEIIKPWEDQTSSIIKCIANSAQYFEEWRIALDVLIKNLIIPNITKSETMFKMPVKLIKKLPKMAQLRLVQILINQENDLWSKHQLQMLYQFLNKNETGKLIKLSNNWYLLHDREMLIGQEQLIITEVKAIEIFPNKQVNYINNRIEIAVFSKIDNIKEKFIESVDWSKLKNRKLEIRIWKNGDTFIPLGMKGRQKVSDYLINEKVDRISKLSQCVLTADGKIAWVCGMRISDWVKITDATCETAILIFSPMSIRNN